jgi:anti-anti-sigma factor
MKAVKPLYRYLEIRQTGTVTVIRFTTPALVGEETIETVGRELFTLEEKLGSHSLLLNFESVDSLGSAMLGKLITLTKRRGLAGGRLALCGINQHLFEKIFEIYRLSRFFTVYDDEEAALQAL